MEDLINQLEHKCKIEDFREINAKNTIWNFWKITKENIIFTSNNKEYNIKYKDIYKFYIIENKSKNDCNNKIREKVIISIALYKIPVKWLCYSWWYNIYQELHKTIKLICKNFNKLVVEYKGGRNNNFDFLFEFYLDDKKIQTKIEFKYNVNKIEKCPQFLSISCNYFTKISYAEYFFDEYIHKICKIYNIDIPDKNQYLKHIYSSNYKSLPFFDFLYNNEKTDINKFNEKNRLVKLSIKNYLEKDIINIEELNKKLITSQENKIYLLFHNNHFYIETITEDELTCHNVKHIKNNNTIIITTRKTEIHMLLRWKNHIGVLYPAWQISLKR